MKALTILFSLFFFRTTETIQLVELGCGAAFPGTFHWILLPSCYGCIGFLVTCGWRYPQLALPSHVSYSYTPNFCLCGGRNLTEKPAINSFATSLYAVLTIAYCYFATGPYMLTCYIIVLFVYIMLLLVEFPNLYCRRFCLWRRSPIL